MLVGLDGDDTLWHNESMFRDIEGRFAELVGQYVPGVDAKQQLVATEMRNVALYGYGAKSFALSMIETAVDVTQAAVSSADLTNMLEWAKELLAHPVELLPGVAETVTALSEGSEQLVLITKGDLLHQQNKAAASGLSGLFTAVEVVAEKDEATYTRVLERHAVKPGSFVMVGNSIKSDVLPVLAIGGQAVHIPYHMTWELEQAHPPEAVDGYWELEDIRQLPAFLRSLES